MDKVATDKPTDDAKLPVGGRKGDAPTSLATVPSTGLGSAPSAPGPSAGNDDEKSSLKIKIHLDIEVEVHLTARVKGDIVIGLL